VGQVTRKPPSTWDVFVFGVFCFSTVIVASWLAGC